MQSSERLMELLNEVIEYNPHYPASYINKAKINIRDNNIEEAIAAYDKAKELLSESDNDFMLVRALEQIRSQLDSNS